MNDCTELFKQVTLRKTASEIAAIRVSAKFTEYCTRQMIDHLEALIDQDTMHSLQKISNKIEGLLDSDLTSFKAKFHTPIDTQLLEFAFLPSVQANAHFDLKIGA